MSIRPVLILTGIVSAILGAIVVYLVLSVPNDLRADSLLKDARKDIEAQKHDEARKKLSSIVQQYPRTDAAAAATVALVTLAESDRQKLERDLATLRTQNTQQSKLIADLQKGLTEVKNAPPKIVTVQAPAPKPPAVKKTPPRKTTPAKKKTTRRKR
jgi:hypothetical protein